MKSMGFLNWNTPDGVPLYNAPRSRCLPLSTALPFAGMSGGTVAVLADCMRVFCIYEERPSVDVLVIPTFETIGL